MLATKESGSPTPPPELLDYEFPLGREESTSGRASPSPPPPPPPPPPRSLTPQVFAFPSSRKLISHKSLNSGFSSFKGRHKSTNGGRKSGTRRSISPGSRGNRAHSRPSVSPSRLSCAVIYKGMQVASQLEAKDGESTVEGASTDEEGEESCMRTDTRGYKKEHLWDHSQNSHTTYGKTGPLSNPIRMSTPPRSPHPLASYTGVDAQAQDASEGHAAIPAGTEAVEVEAQEHNAALPDSALLPSSTGVTAATEATGLRSRRQTAGLSITTEVTDHTDVPGSTTAQSITSPGNTAAQPITSPAGPGTTTPHARTPDSTTAQRSLRDKLQPRPPSHEATPNGTIRSKLQPPYHEPAPNGMNGSKSALGRSISKAASAAQTSQAPSHAPSFRHPTLTALAAHPSRMCSSPEPATSARTLSEAGARTLGEPAAPLPEGQASPLSHSSDNSPDHQARSVGTPLQPSPKITAALTLPLPLPLTIYARKPPTLTTFPAPPQPPAQYHTMQYPTAAATLPSCSQPPHFPSSPGHRPPPPWPPSPPTSQAAPPQGHKLIKPEGSQSKRLSASAEAAPLHPRLLPYLSIDNTSSTTRPAPLPTQPPSPPSPVHKRMSRLHRTLTSQDMPTTSESLTDPLLRRSAPGFVTSNSPEATPGPLLLSPLKPLTKNAHSAQDLVALQQQQQQQQQQIQQQQQQQQVPSLFLNLQQSPHSLALQQSPHSLALQQSPHSLALQQSPHSPALQQSPHSLALQQSPHSLALQQSPHSPAAFKQAPACPLQPSNTLPAVPPQPCSPAAPPQPSHSLTAFKQAPACPPLARPSQATRKQASLMPTFSITQPLLRRSKTQS